MIISGDELEDGTRLEADLCLVGGGPAAISIALEMVASGKKVLLISGGGWSETIANQDLHRGASVPAGSHEPLEENRRRQFGGASAAWGGRCIPFEPLDFRKRDWVPDSGWPFSYEELRPYYERAAVLCQCGEFEFDARKVFPQAPGEILPGFDDGVFVSYPLERWSPPVNFAKEYHKELEAAENLRVLLDVHVLAFRMTDATDRISHIEIAAGEKRLTVKAEQFVLAAGGIENARLLLVSANDHFPTGLGNHHDNVGRYYMSHLFGNFAEVIPKDRENLNFEFDKEGVYCRRRWWITEETQERKGLLNTIFFLYQCRSQEGHRDALFSAMFIAKSLLSVVSQKVPGKMMRRSREILPGLREHGFNLLKNGFKQLPEIARISLKRMSRRRLPYVLPGKSTLRWGLYFQAEQTPCRESRIRLSESQKDTYGMPRVEALIGFNPGDAESVVKAHELFVSRFRERNLGEIVYSSEGFRDYLAASERHFNSAAHHLGTTRMSDDPMTGVVDRNACVHGIKNLFVAGSSVFPTGGHANPTLTLVAQALRLAHHLTK